MRFLLLITLPLVLVACSRSSTAPPTNSDAAVTLTLHSGEELVNPTDEQIRNALSLFVAGPDRDSFAIFARSEMTYIQISGDKSIGFDMEYQKGDVQSHYRAERTDFPLDDIVRALSEYRDGTIDWSDYGDWAPITW